MSSHIHQSFSVHRMATTHTSKAKATAGRRAVREVAGTSGASTATSATSASVPSADFVKFPRTHHLIDSGGSAVSRDDLVLGDGDIATFLSPAPGHVLTVEEKVDGANLGISIAADGQIRAQNRSHFVNSQTHRQFAALDTWVGEHEETLRRLLRPGSGDTLFGEWLLAVHSIRYTRLPSYFLAFDIYDGVVGKFFSRVSRDAALRGTGIRTVRTIATGADAPTTKEALLRLLDSRSQYYDGYVEGVYLRLDEAPAHGTVSYHVSRSKIVRPDFTQAIDEHWTKKEFTKNVLDLSLAYEEEEGEL